MTKLLGYRDEKGEWRWRLFARNGRIVADSGESYSKLGNLRRAITNFKYLVSGKMQVKIEEDTKPEPKPADRGASFYRRVVDYLG